MGYRICMVLGVTTPLLGAGLLAVSLALVVFFLVFKLYHIKQQLRKIVQQLEGQNHISVEFVDRDLEAAALQMNRMIDRMQEIKTESVKKEKSIKSSISMISHDMRTPLTSVIGYLQLAGKSCRDEEVLQDINIALGRAEYCNRLVNDFFELSVVDLGQYTPVMEKVNICEMVCEEIMAGYPDFEKSGRTPIFGQADDAILVWADRKLLARVIQNLISNAIKYATGKVNFTVVTGEKVSLYISSSVSGHMDAEKIFDRYYQEENSRHREGAGLGLYICRKFVESMGGGISAVCDGSILTIKMELGGWTG